MLAAVKDRITKIKNKFMQCGFWIRNKYRANRKKCRGTIISLLLLMLLTGLIMGSFKSVDSLSQGVPINYTDGQIKDQTAANFGSFMGLNTYYHSIPNVNFIVEFNNAKAGQLIKNRHKSINARVIEGTRLQIDVQAKARVVTTNLKSFIQNFGIDLVDGVHEGWQIYIKEKIRNVVVQEVAKFKFHQISNKALALAINSQLMSYETNPSLYYPFILRVISINLHYPQKTLQANDTLGIKLLQQTSLLNQLNNRITTIKSYIASYQYPASQYQSKRATINGQIVNRQNAVKLASDNWIAGVQLFNATVGNSTLLQKYLQIYFNSLYNVTYRLESLQPFRI